MTKKSSSYIFLIYEPKCNLSSIYFYKGIFLFFKGGCNGNENQFDTVEKCDEKCNPKENKLESTKSKFNFI
jgi:hypothetical protein